MTITSTTLLYLFITLLSVTAYPSEYASWLEYIRDLDHLEGIKALPAFYAAQHYLGSLGVGLLMASFLALIITSLIGNITALSRLFHAMGKDRILPARFAEINAHGAPGNAIRLIVGLSLLIPFLGRTAIGWIVDVTTIGATIIYAFVSASARKLALKRSDRAEKWTGTIGFALMIIYLLYLLLPNLVSRGSMAKESYFLFIVWSILGFLFFRNILHRDKARRFSESVIVWMALLALVLFIALIWTQQSMISSNQVMMDHIREYYTVSGDASQLRLADELFIGQQMNELEKANTQTILMATGMFIFALVIMLSNYSFMNKQTKESQRIANTDPLTGVKSKHAYLMREKELDDEISRSAAKGFSVVVCNVNGLKFINDTWA
ncbi:MAG: amino acid permease [Clostridia bacterium]|nr:amino acid permease [Clostridia bacterium]